MLRILFLRLALAAPAAAETRTAVFAGGCFWCVEANFEHVPGVTSAVSGYSGGQKANPTYKDHEGHLEVVRVTYDDAVVSYEKLVGLFLRSIDVTDAGGQFCDRGPAYRSAIFVSDKAERAIAEAEVARAEATLGRKVVTPVLAAKRFWPAEDYHQDYARQSEIILTRAGPMQKKNAYKFYRKSCGRDARVREIWGAEAAFVK